MKHSTALGFPVYTLDIESYKRARFLEKIKQGRAHYMLLISALIALSLPLFATHFIV